MTHYRPLVVSALLLLASSAYGTVNDVKTILLRDARPPNALNNDSFTVLEFQAFETGTGTNVAAQAFGSIATATSDGFGGTPDGAIDGDTSSGCCGQLWHGTDNNAVLTITLPSSVSLDDAAFSGRGGCCDQSRADNFILELFDDGGNRLFSKQIMGAGTHSNGGTTPVGIPLEPQLFGGAAVNVALGGKPTSAGPQAFGGSAAGAADGIFVGVGNWIHSDTAGTHFWEIDLQGSARLTEFAMHGRSGFLERVNGSTISFMDHTGAVVGTHVVNITSGLTDTVQLGTPLLARSVRIEGPDPQDTFNWYEFEAVAENLAQGKPTTQSSVFGGFDADGSEATDGITETFSHTATGDQTPTLTVDLLDKFELDSIVLHNRDSCCGDRLSDIVVDLFDEEMNPVFTSDILNPANALGSPATLGLDFHELMDDSVAAQFIQVTKVGGPTDQFFLSLGEVQAFGVPFVPIPEPMTGTLAMLGLAVLASRRRRAA